MLMRDYAADPCRASSLPFWKAESVTVPPCLSILRDDEFSALSPQGKDEPYFKLIHHLKAIPSPALPEGFAIVPCDIPGFARHINSCYQEEGVSPEELAAYLSHPVYAPDLWLALAETDSGRIAATGIGEMDERIGEGVLEWIQVSPEYRRRGLGAFLVCELLRRMRGRARFITVSGRVNSESRPLALYRSCGFENPVIWHVVTKG